MYNITTQQYIRAQTGGRGVGEADIRENAGMPPSASLKGQDLNEVVEEEEETIENSAERVDLHKKLILRDQVRARRDIDLDHYVLSM